MRENLGRTLLLQSTAVVLRGKWSLKIISAIVLSFAREETRDVIYEAFVSGVLRPARVKSLYLRDFRILSQACELHFILVDIIREATHVDDMTGRRFTVPLPSPYLRRCCCLNISLQGKAACKVKPSDEVSKFNAWDRLLCRKHLQTR